MNKFDTKYDKKLQIWYKNDQIQYKKWHKSDMNKCNKKWLEI